MSETYTSKKIERKITTNHMLVIIKLAEKILGILAHQKTSIF